MTKKSKHLIYKSQDLFYISAGEGPIALVLIHGLAGDSRFFHNQIKYFSPMFKIIVPDLPGHGRSDKYSINSIDDYVDALKAVIEKEEIKNPIILGHSMGGAVAINYYLKHRNSVKALILVSSSGRFNIDNKTIEAAEKNFDAFYESLVKDTFSRKAGLFLAAAKKGIPELQKKGILEGLKICSRIDLSEEIKGITIPVLLIGNKQDQVLPIDLTADTGRNIAGSKTVILDKKGHMPFFEESEVFNAEIETFISSL